MMGRIFYHPSLSKNQNKMEGAALAEARFHEGEAHLESGRYAAAEQCLLEAYRVYQSAVGANGEMSGRTIGTLGAVYLQMGRLEEATNAYKDSLRIYRNIEGERGPNSGNILINIGNALIMQVNAMM
jgi:tetratricopeptide (TPR) repeat protein